MMSYPVTRGLLRHGICGCIAIALFLVHHLLNLGWHRSLLRGRWSARRILLSAADILLVAVVCALIASSLVMAGDVFPFAPFPMPWWGRDLHGAATAWCFVLSSFHLGLHGHGFWSLLRSRLHAVMGRIWIILPLAAFAAGSAAFLQSGLPDRLLLLEASGGHPSPCLFFAQYAAIALSCCLLARWLWHLTGVPSGRVSHGDK